MPANSTTSNQKARQRKHEQRSPTYMRNKYWFLLILVGLLSRYTNAQCPGSPSCEGAPVLCAFEDLNGFSCQTLNVPNTTFPLPNLCYGSGTPTNISYWTVIGGGNPVTMTITGVSGSCAQGFQAGVFEGYCERADHWDCNADCAQNVKSLSGATNPCEVYTLWIDGCNGSLCDFTISVSGGSRPKLPSPLPSIRHVDGYCVGQEMLFVTQFSSCNPIIEWEIDGVYAGRGQRTYLVATELRPYEICYTAYIGNPDFPASVCEEARTCTTFTPTVPTRTGGFRRLCALSEPYDWHGTLITRSCINPPCSTRVVERSTGCLVDSFTAFIVGPPEQRIGPLLNVPVSEVPFQWHNLTITSSCINPPCTTRLETRDGCLFDSIRQIRIIYSSLDSVIVKGKVYSDLNANCDDDTGEPLLEGIQINLNNARRSFQTLTDSNGCYSILVPFDTFDIQALDPTDSIIACPINQTIGAFTQDSIYCVDFYKSPSQCYPGRLKWLPLTGRNRLRCDPLERTISLEAYNYTNAPLAEEEIIVQVDSLFTLLSASFPFRTISNTEMAITLPEIPAGGKVIVSIRLVADCDRNNTTNAICFTAFYSAQHQCNGNLLRDRTCESILNSRDPNDLRVSPYGFGDARYILRENTLTGIIRYHNDGTDTAYDITVDLTIDWERADRETFELLQSSGEIITMHTTDQGVQFDLPNVRLPHNDIDSVNSHGYIVYRVKPRPEIPDWYMIAQQAFIFFDFNDAIETNVERQIIAGPYLTEFFEVPACVGDTVQDRLILRDTTFADTLFTTRPFTINTYSVRAWPSYLFEKDTIVLAGDVFMGTFITEDTVLTVDHLTNKGCDSTYVYNIEAKTTSTQGQAPVVDLYPNPLHGTDLMITASHCTLQTVEIIAQNGVVQKYELNDRSHFRLQREQLEDGMYFYRITTSDGKILSGKLMVMD